MVANTSAVDKLLDNINDSIVSTSKSLDSLIEAIDGYGSEYPELVQHLKASVEGEGKGSEGMSLLSLKNSSLLGYLDSLAAVIGTRLDSMKTDQSIEDDKAHERSVSSSVVHRVTLDKGVKPLEKKLSYQLDKLMDSYRRREREQKSVNMESARKSTKETEEEVDEEEEEDEELETEGLNFKPDPSSLLKTARKEDGNEIGDEKYRPPKISATLPPSNFSEKAEKKEGRQRNLQSMDEYLQEVGDAPTVEGSIGATITNRGRDLKTKKQLEKEAEIKRYEEENFIRLPASKAKESGKERRKRMRNEFFGEDWSMFENARDINESSGKRKKKQGAWQRAKKRRDAGDE
ncbi:DEKNAAC102116 [Brettanomyces naardenensis]|uniref:DEKNAAC102116 n=1 Tax=Brettanomyces naardenensis TaxID=13370 RepID=A0A448YJQ4_BRENA|nr:DEKNAAC102116 [Brettanomyces naardenensis]